MEIVLAESGAEKTTAFGLTIMYSRAIGGFVTHDERSRPRRAAEQPLLRSDITRYFLVNWGSVFSISLPLTPLKKSECILRLLCFVRLRRLTRLSP